MDHYSWEDSRLPKGFLIDAKIASQRSEWKIATHMLKPGKFPKSSFLVRTDCDFVIGRAYQEPQALNLVEDLLLQRDYIID